MQNKFLLNKAMFTEKENLILESSSMRAYAFRYSTGVEAVRVENEKGYFIILPYQGQQIWRANFLGQELTMQTTFDEPVATDNFLASYGCFLMHCGVTAMGCPSDKDNHAQHGELPVAIYKDAYLISGVDEKGEYIAVSGSIEGKVSFTRNYLFTPQCRLYSDSTLLDVTVNLKNLRSKPFTYMYLCHINFRPVDGAELIYSAKYDKEHFKVHKIVPANMAPDKAKELKAYMDALQKDPTIHHKVGAPGQVYDPEICSTVIYTPDENNRAHTMQLLPDGTAFYVNHPADTLPIGIRWISRTGDENSMGMVLPATAEHLGYTHAEKNGQLKELAPHSEITFNMYAGLLEKDNAKKTAEHINSVSGN